MFTARSNRQELMDDPSIDPSILCTTLDDLARVNALLGGYPPSIDAVARLARGRRTLSVLDVGCGAGDIPRILSKWARFRGLELSIDAIEISDVAAEHARRRCADFPQIRVEATDLFDIDEERNYDIVHAALMLHHLDDEEARRGLAKMARLSRLGVVINDLHRHAVAYMGSRLVLPLLSKNRLIRHDGPLSIRRSFRAEELRRLAFRAGLPRPHLRWFPLFRWQMIISCEKI